MERRNFIQTCAVVVGSTVLPMGCGSGGSSDGGSDGGSDEVSISDDFSLPNLERNRWTSLDDNNFSVAHENGATDMQLTSIDDEMYDPATDQFSVVLTGPELPQLEEGVYQVYNSSFDYIDLYMQPGESPAGEQRYRSVFSVLRT
jgi:hypothetical protein